MKSKLNNISLSRRSLYILPAFAAPPARRAGIPAIGPLFRGPRQACGITRMLPLLALPPALGSAVTISGSAACSIGDGYIGLSSSSTAPLSSESTANCGLATPQPAPAVLYSKASVSAAAFSVSASANVAAGISLDPHGVPVDIVGSSSGKASVTEQYQVETTGPVRPGFLVLTPLVSTTPDLDSGTTAAEIAVGNSILIQSNQGSTAHCSPCEFAVSLGTIYDFTLEASVDSEANFLIPDDSGSASAGLSFQFFEANGTTPVTAEVIPEPATISLVGCALLVALVLRLRRKENAWRVADVVLRFGARGRMISAEKLRDVESAESDGHLATPHSSDSIVSIGNNLWSHCDCCRWYPLTGVPSSHNKIV